MEKKVVETVDFRSQAGHGQTEKKPVQVVHEFVDDKSSHAHANKESK